VTVARRLVDGGAAALVSALVHLLGQNDWARAKLAMFVGRVVRIGVDAPALAGLPPPQLLARIVDGGLLELVPWPSDGEPEVAVNMLLRPSVDAAFALLRDGPGALSPHLRIDGEVMLAGALGEIARHLRWDVEEDLSRIAGDALARRIGGAVESGRTTALDLRSRLESSAIGYLAGDGGQLIAGGRLAALRAGIDGLENRVARLESQLRVPGGGPPSGPAR
jgi:ubiquinone biosynthesis protein UbiJ